MKFSFKFGKRFGEDRLTPGQRTVVDRLEKGEISAEEAGRLLSRDARTFQIRIGEPPGDADREAQATEREPTDTDEDAKAREMIERIAQEVDAEGRR